MKGQMQAIEESGDDPDVNVDCEEGEWSGPVVEEFLKKISISHLNIKVGENACLHFARSGYLHDGRRGINEISLGMVKTPIKSAFSM